MGSETTGENTITIKKVAVLDLKRWLDIPLPAGAMNRNRNEFLRVLKPLADEIEAGRLEILAQHAKKDEVTGEIDYESPKFATTADDKKAQEEYLALLQEPINLFVAKPMALTVVKSILQSTQAKFVNEEGERFDDVCDALKIEFPEELTPIVSPLSNIPKPQPGSN